MPDVTIHIPTDKVNKAKKLFIQYPVPLDENDQPLYTDLEWFKKIIIVLLVREYQTSLQIESRKNLVIDKDVFT
jgi:hypothetical protein